MPVKNIACVEEAAIDISYPTSSHTLYAGNSYDIRWTGGPTSDEVFIAFTASDLSDDEAFSVTDWSTGAGIPFVAVPNTGAYAWAVQ